MNPRDIQLRIGSIRKTQQITRAMKMVAAVKFRQAQTRLLNARPYAARLGSLTANALNQLAGADQFDGAAGALALLRQVPVQRRLVLVIASDKGLCGNYNSNIYRAILRFLQAAPPTPQGRRCEVGLLLVGRKIKDLFKHCQLSGLACSIHRYLPAAQADYAVIAEELSDLFSTGQYDRVDAFFTEFKSVLQSQVVRQQLLPLHRAADPAATAPDILLEPSLTAILADLLPRWLLSRVQQMLLEAEASEQSTRMQMMDQATKNADDLISQLQLDFNKARQWNITRELSDITTGVEAMS